MRFCCKEDELSNICSTGFWHDLNKLKAAEGFLVPQILTGVNLFMELCS